MPGQKASEAERREQIIAAAYQVASRNGLEKLTVRAVAAKAGLSHGLVLYHFNRKDQLVRALLDWLLKTASLLDIPASIASIADPPDRLYTLVRQELDRASSDPHRSQLLFEYWALGSRHAAIRTRIKTEMDRYRVALRVVVQDVLDADPERFAAVSADGLAAVVQSLIYGCAVQAMIGPRHFDIEEYLDAIAGLVGQTASSAR